MSDEKRIKDRCVCPGCDSRNDGHMESTDPSSEDMPEHGDISICSYCGTISKYDVTEGVRTLRTLTEPERKQALADPDVVRALSILMELSHRGG